MIVEKPLNLNFNIPEMENIIDNDILEKSFKEFSSLDKSSFVIIKNELDFDYQLNMVDIVGEICHIDFNKKSITIKIFEEILSKKISVHKSMIPVIVNDFMSVNLFCTVELNENNSIKNVNIQYASLKNITS